MSLFDAFSYDGKRVVVVGAATGMGCAVAKEAFPLLERGIRVNAILPGSTDTPLAQANAATPITNYLSGRA